MVIKRPYSVQLLIPQTEQEIKRDGADLSIFEILDAIKNLTKPVNRSYPGHDKWFYNKFVPEFLCNKRTVLYVGPEEAPIGVALLKDDEKKISTLYVKPEHQGQGMGRLLLTASMKILGTDHPYVTVSEAQMESWEPLLESYGSHVKYITKGVYQPGCAEYHFNPPHDDPRKFGGLYTSLYFDEDKKIWRKPEYQ